HRSPPLPPARPSRSPHPPLPSLPLFFLQSPRYHRHLHSFPTRRSSDLFYSAAADRGRNDVDRSRGLARQRGRPPGRIVAKPAGRRRRVRLGAASRHSANSMMIDGAPMLTVSLGFIQSPLRARVPA